MNQQQANRRIAEIMGIECEPCTCGPDHWRDAKNGGHIPDYCNDLNACHEIWDSLSTDDKMHFQKQLQRVILSNGDAMDWLVAAKAVHRAEAFLRVKDPGFFTGSVEGGAE